MSEANWRPKPDANIAGRVPPVGRGVNTPVVEVNVYLGDESEGIIVPVRELGEIYNFVRYEVFPGFNRFFKPSEIIG